MGFIQGEVVVFTVVGQVGRCMHIICCMFLT